MLSRFRIPSTLVRSTRRQALSGSRVGSPSPHICARATALLDKFGCYNFSTKRSSPSSSDTTRTVKNPRRSKLPSTGVAYITIISRFHRKRDWKKAAETAIAFESSGLRTTSKTVTQLLCRAYSKDNQWDRVLAALNKSKADGSDVREIRDDMLACAVQQGSENFSDVVKALVSLYPVCLHRLKAAVDVKVAEVLLRAENIDAAVDWNFSHVRRAMLHAVGQLLLDRAHTTLANQSRLKQLLYDNVRMDCKELAVLVGLSLVLHNWDTKQAVGLLQRFIGENPPSDPRDIYSAIFTRLLMFGIAPNVIAEMMHAFPELDPAVDPEFLLEMHKWAVKLPNYAQAFPYVAHTGIMPLETFHDFSFARKTAVQNCQLWAACFGNVMEKVAYSYFQDMIKKKSANGRTLQIAHEYHLKNPKSELFRDIPHAVIDNIALLENDIVAFADVIEDTAAFLKRTYLVSTANFMELLYKRFKRKFSTPELVNLDPFSVLRATTSSSGLDEYSEEMDFWKSKGIQWPPEQAGYHNWALVHMGAEVGRRDNRVYDRNGLAIPRLCVEIEDRFPSPPATS